MSIPKGAYQALKAIVGDEYISNDPVTLRAYKAKSYRRETMYDLVCTPPDCVVLPQTTDEVQRIVKLCTRYRIPYTPISTYWLANGAPKEPMNCSST